MEFNIPLHHLIVKKKRQLFQGFVVPELHLIDRNGQFVPYEPMNLFFDKNSAKKLPTLIKASRVVGFFYDYLVQQQHCFKNTNRRYRKTQLFTSFANHLLHGTISQESGRITDTTGLLWAGHSDAAASGMLYAFDMFVTLIMTLGATSCDPLVELCEGLFDEQPGLMTSDGGFVGFRLLAHLNDTLPEKSESPKAVKTAKSAKGIFKTEGIATYLNSPTYRFPSDLIDVMAKDGFVKNSEAINILKREDATGKMQFQIFRCGIRISETLQMWVNDLQIVDGRLIGFLRHPENFKEPGSNLTRKQVLRETYDMLPRTRQVGRLRAGWKSPGLNKEGWSLLSWLPGTEKDVLDIFTDYILYVRNPIMRARMRAGHPDHPFLLIHTRTIRSDQPDQSVLAGDPYSISAARDGFTRGVGRVAKLHPDRGLEIGKDHGTTPHAMRHDYGHTLEENGDNPKQIQKKMHHRSVLSSRAYRGLDDQDVHNALEAARARQEQGNTPDDLFERRTIEEVLDDLLEGGGLYL